MSGACAAALREAGFGTADPGDSVSSPALVRAGLGVAFAVALTFLTLPVVAIFVDSSPRELIESLGDPVARDALWLSLETTSISLR